MHRDPYRLFTQAAVVNLVGYFVHLRQGMGLTPPLVIVSGSAAGVVGFVALGLARARHPLAPEFAMLAGFPAAVGFAVVHFPPDWGAFSQSYGSGADAISWLVVAFSIGCSLLLGIAGAWVARQRRAALPT